MRPNNSSLKGSFDLGPSAGYNIHWFKLARASPYLMGMRSWLRFVECPLHVP
jgi:hypothetical protein